MFNIDRYSIFEAKVSKDWAAIMRNKLIEFKKMFDDNPVLEYWENKNLLNDLTQNIKDISDKIVVNYDEYVEFICSDDRISTHITHNGEIINTNVQRYSYYRPYNEYIKITRWLDKNRFSGNEIETVYHVYFEIMGLAYLSDSEISDLNLESENNKEFLKSLGFNIRGSSYDIKASIKLAKTDKSLIKTLDLSDLVPTDIVDSFEAFIIKRGLSRQDAEELSKIFIKKN